MKFTGAVLAAGKTATGIEVPPEVLEALGGGKRPLVAVTINGFTNRSTVGSMDGKTMLPLSAENRQKTGTAAGDRVEVDLTLDTEKRDVEVPTALAEALEANPAAKTAFEKLSNNAKKRHTLSVEEAKTDDTRQRLLDKAFSELIE